MPDFKVGDRVLYAGNPNRSLPGTVLKKIPGGYVVDLDNLGQVSCGPTDLGAAPKPRETPKKAPPRRSRAGGGGSTPGR